jgi:hypothetical protein
VEAEMASAVVLVLIAIAFVVLFGGFLIVSFALRRDDRDLGSIQFDAPNHSARAVRSLVGMTASRLK